MTTPQACRVCANPFERAPGRFHYGRGLCARCYGRAQRRGTLERWPTTSRRDAVWDLIEDVAFLAWAGEPPASWAGRLGYDKPASLRRLLRRYGRNDLARQIPQ